MADFGGDLDTFRADVRTWLDANFPEAFRREPSRQAALAAGMADDLVGSLFLAWELQKKPWWVAPAMNTAMFEHPLTQASLQKLAGLGVRVLPTGTGPLACGEEGAGRLLEPEQLVLHVLAELGQKLA